MSCSYRQAGDVLAGLFRDGRVWEQARAYGGLAAAWEAAAVEAGVGNAVAHARIAGLERGVVTIEADHPGWVQLLQTAEGRLLHIFQRRLAGLGLGPAAGPLQGICVRLSRESFAGPGEEAEDAAAEGVPPYGPAPPEPPAAALELPGAAAASAEDAAYRAARARLERSMRLRSARGSVGTPPVPDERARGR